jgi:hypothetical protein
VFGAQPPRRLESQHDHGSGDPYRDRSINLETVILVYHNQQMLGSTEVLRSFPLENIRSIRYLDAAQAGQLPGSTGRHVEAAIVISTR